MIVESGDDEKAECGEGDMRAGSDSGDDERLEDGDAIEVDVSLVGNKGTVNITIPCVPQYG